MTLQERLAKGLGVPVREVVSLARTSSYHYKTYEIPKRNGSKRTIHHPSRQLKAVQRWLLMNVVTHLPVHSSATAYRPGQSILNNASVHSASRFLLRMDFENFFPSITRADILFYIAERPQMFSASIDTEADASIFCDFVCRKSTLTIGAPTSPALSNAICRQLDVSLEEMCVRNSVSYTRYADDLFFSTTNENVLGEIQAEVVAIVSKLQVPAGLKINGDKTRHSSKKGLRRVTGIVLGSDSNPYIGRHLKRRIRALIHRYEELDERTKASLIGLVNFSVGLDPDFKNSLIQKYGLAQINRVLKR